MISGILRRRGVNLCEIYPPGVSTSTLQLNFLDINRKCCKTRTIELRYMGSWRASIQVNCIESYCIMCMILYYMKGFLMLCYITLDFIVFMLYCIIFYHVMFCSIIYQARLYYIVLYPLKVNILLHDIPLYL